MRKIILFVLACITVGRCANADELTNRLDHLRPEMVRQFSMPVSSWRFHQPAVVGAEQPDFDDSAWPSVSPGFSWDGQNTNASLRAKITVPATVAGLPVEGMAVRLQLGLTGRTELYVNGQLRDFFRGDTGQYTLTEHARAGQTFWVALRPGSGQRNNNFHFARLYCDVLPDFDHYRDELAFVNLLQNKIPGRASNATVKTGIERQRRLGVQFTTVTPQNLADGRQATGAGAGCIAADRRYHEEIRCLLRGPRAH